MVVRASLATDTLRALLSPRRLLPTLLVCGPLVVAQATLSVHPGAGPMAVAMCVAFVGVAPLCWRWLFPLGREVDSRLLRLLLYAAISFAVVALIGGLLPWAIHMGPTFLTDHRTLASVVALFMVGGWGLARDIELEQGLVRERQRAEELAREAERAQLLAMRSHLDPHFLFNTLNAIAEHCRQDGVTAERACLLLASMLRTVMAGVREAAWPLTHELELARTLFSLHRIRDPELFQLDEEGEAPEDVEVPPMILLPLAENAVKHGPAAGHRGVMRLGVEERDGGVAVRLSNPGPFAGPRDGGAGLSMVERRLDLAYRGAARLSMRRDGQRTVAEVWLPRRLPEVNT